MCPKEKEDGVSDRGKKGGCATVGGRVGGAELGTASRERLEKNGRL